MKSQPSGKKPVSDFYSQDDAAVKRNAAMNEKRSRKPSIYDEADDEELVDQLYDNDDQEEEDYDDEYDDDDE